MFDENLSTTTGSVGATNMAASLNVVLLVVEDEPDIRDLIALHLRREGYQVLTASSVADAKSLIEGHKFDCLVVDWMLPGESGLELTQSLRTRSQLPILMVTARTEPADVVKGLEAGADDYITKPFDPAILLARVKALLRRAQRPSPDSGADEVRFGDVTLYPQTYDVKCCGESIQLTPSEFKMLLALSQQKGRVLTRDALISYVQGEGVSVVGRTVDTHIFGLRKKLGSCADVVETIRGVGYRIKS